MSEIGVTKFIERAADRSGTVGTITIEHKRLHEGFYFIADYYQDTLGATGTVNIAIQTGDRFEHIKPALIYLPDTITARIEIYDGAEFTGGTELQVLNKNLTSSRVAESKLYANPTINDDGTLRRTSYVLGTLGQGNARTGGSFSEEEEFILAKNSTYMLRVVNMDAQTRFLFRSEWYEV